MLISYYLFMPIIHIRSRQILVMINNKTCSKSIFKNFHGHLPNSDFLIFNCLHENTCMYIILFFIYPMMRYIHSSVNVGSTSHVTKHIAPVILLSMDVAYHAGSHNYLCLGLTRLKIHSSDFHHKN